MFLATDPVTTNVHLTPFFHVWRVRMLPGPAYSAKHQALCWYVRFLPDGTLPSNKLIRIHDLPSWGRSGASWFPSGVVYASSRFSFFAPLFWFASSAASLVIESLLCELPWSNLEKRPENPVVLLHSGHRGPCACRTSDLGGHGAMPNTAVHAAVAPWTCRDASGSRIEHIHPGGEHHVPVALL